MERVSLGFVNRGLIVALSALGVLSAPGCGSDPGPVIDAGVAICASHAQCDDGDFCNGSEQCLPGDPSAAPNGCVAGVSPCMPTQQCDESGGSCVTVCAVEPDADGDGALALLCGGRRLR